jgi:hypothetical protein
MPWAATAQAEREVQQSEAEVAGRVLAVAQARQRVVELRATLARVESQRHQVTLKESEVGRAEARLPETKADQAYAELQLQYTEVRADRWDGLEEERGGRADGAEQASRSWPSSRCRMCGWSRTSRRRSWPG